MNLNKQDIIKNYRCLRENLQSVLSPESRDVMKQIELLAAGNKTNNLPAVSKGQKSNLTHKQRVHRYL